MSIDPIQDAIEKIEKQRKDAGFNVNVLLTAIKEKSTNFKKVRELDDERNKEIIQTLNESLSNIESNSVDPIFWSKKAESHAKNHEINSRLYEAMIALFGVITTYFIGASNILVSLIFGILLICFIVSKWGVDRYISALNQTAVCLEYIHNSSTTNIEN